MKDTRAYSNTTNTWCYTEFVKMPLVPDYIANLNPYQPGRNAQEVARAYNLSRVVKLGSNENPLGSSPASLEAIRQAISNLNIYPDGGLLLRQTLAREFDTKPENVIAGNGSEALISNIIRTFLCDDDEVLTTEAAFIGFQVVAKSRGTRYRTVPLTPEYSYDLAAIAAAITGKTKIIYLANPNNPTGTIFSKHEFDAFYRHVPERVLIILDEAYFEYAKDNPRYPDSMSYRYDNVITLRTFSKVYGLAGARIGYGFAHEELIANLLKVKLPFEPGSLAQAAGIAALRDRAFLHRSLETNARGMEALRRVLEAQGHCLCPFVRKLCHDGLAKCARSSIRDRIASSARCHRSAACRLGIAQVRAHLNRHGRRDRVFGRRSPDSDSRSYGIGIKSPLTTKGGVNRTGSPLAGKI